MTSTCFSTIVRPQIPSHFRIYHPVQGLVWYRAGLVAVQSRSAVATTVLALAVPAAGEVVLVGTAM